MEKIGLVEAIDALRSELAAAVEKAQGQAIEFPINGQHLASEYDDSAYKQGQIGVEAYSEGKLTNGAFSNAKVWIF